MNSEDRDGDYLMLGPQVRSDDMISVVEAIATRPGIKLALTNIQDILIRVEREGNWKGWNVLAKVLLSGKYNEKEVSKALELFQKLAKRKYQLDKQAIYQVALGYHHGLKVPGNMNIAIQWYDLAAQLGHMESLLFLENVYRRGKYNQPVDVEKAQRFLVMAAKDGSLTAPTVLGTIIRYNDARGSVQEKVEWYRSCSASSFNGFPQTQLASLHLFGYIKEPDYALAVKLSQDAAKLGNPEAMNLLGRIYSLGLGVQREYQLAVQYYKQAAKGGNADAFYNIAQMYELGKGVDNNLDIAMAFHQYAYKQFKVWPSHTALIRMNAVNQPVAFDMDAFLNAR
jgi:TPR repeat protein